MEFIIAVLGMLFIVYLPLWLLGGWLSRNDHVVPQNDTRPISLNDDD